MDATDILIENLREALRQIQRSVVLGVVASLSLVLLQFSTATAQAVQLPGPVVPVGPSTAKIILVAVHVVAGFMALTSVEAARGIAREIKNDQMRDAALSYPSFATSSDPVVRVFTCLAPPFFFVIAIIAWAITQRGEEDPWPFVIMAFAFGVLPYLAVFFWAKKLIAPRATEAAHELTEDQAQLLSRQNYDKIRDGMTPEQVRAIFGTPGPTVEALEPDDVYELVWKTSRKEIAVRFKGESSTGKSSVNIVK